MRHLRWAWRLAATVLVVWLGVAPGAAQAAQAERAGGLLHLVIELEMPSAVEVYAAQQAAGEIAAAGLAAATQAQVVAVDQAQQALLAQLAGLDAQVIYRVQRVYNGVAVRVPASALVDLAALPGVRALHPLIPKLPSNSRAVPRLGAPSAWRAAPGLTGDGVTIAIVDTGIDYLHTAFGGPGKGYSANDPTRTGDAPNFPGVKVIGGYDFAGDDYNANAGSDGYQPFPRPDPDPMDCYGSGHGTHVAGSAAGYGVTETGATYGGRYPPPPTTSFRIGPGVAPHAQVYALKVFGCSGSSDLVDLALEWAVDPDGDGDFADRADVINLSLGSPFGAVDDITALAAANAAKTGALVVAAAGNDGDLFYAVSTPGAADAVLTVAASTLPATAAPESITSFSSRGPRRVGPNGTVGLKPDLAAPGDGIVSAKAGSGNGRASGSGTSMSSALAAGAMALLRQAHPADAVDVPAWTAAELKALAMNTALPLADAAGRSYGPTRAGAGRLDISRALAGQVIAYHAAAPDQVSIHFGVPEVLDSYQAVAALRLANKGPAPIALTVGYSTAVPLPGASITVNAGQVITVPAGGFATTPVTLTVDAAALRHLPDPTLTQNSAVPRSWLAEVSGYVTLTPAGTLAGPQPALRVPVYAAPRPVGQLQVNPAGLDMGAARRATRWLTYTGAGLALEDASGTPPSLPVALGGVFTLHRRSPPLQTAPGGMPSLGRYAQADLAAVGLALKLPPRLPQTLDVAVATYAPWSTPHEVRFVVSFDTDLDGTADLQLSNSDHVAWSVLGRGGSDAFAAVLLDTRDRRTVLEPPLNGYAAGQYDTRLFNSRVMVLPVRIADLRLRAGKPRFAYRVESYSEDVMNAQPLGLVVDSTPWIEVDLAAPGLAVDSAANMPALTAVRPGEGVQVVFDAAGAHGNRGLLAVYLHNAVERQVESIPVRYDARAHLPWVSSRNVERYLPRVSAP